MSLYVIDTSVIVKWFNQDDELDIEKAHQIYKELTSNEIIIIVPDLIIIELLNVMIKSKALTTIVINEIISTVLSLPLIVKQPTQSVLELAVDIADRYKITIYDALFVAIAKIENCQLVSDDQKGHGIIQDGTVIMLKNYK